MQKIGIFGGTFNPPHKGHLRLVTDFVEKIKFDKVLIIPTFTPPHKESKELASSLDRLNMCNLQFTDPIYEVSSIEIERGGKSYTYETLQQLKENYKDAQFYLIIGSDMFLTLHEWKFAEEILNLCTVCTAVRDNDESIEKMQEYISQHFDNLSDKIEMVLSDLKPLEVSSTQLREMFKKGESTQDYLLESVEDYIKTRGLYDVE